MRLPRTTNHSSVRPEHLAVLELVSQNSIVLDLGCGNGELLSLDYVILCQSFQQVRKPDIVLREASRVGKEVIVSFPNFGHYRVWLQICFTTKTPVTPCLPYQWYDTPNLHFLAVSDFIKYCGGKGIKIMESVSLEEEGGPASSRTYSRKSGYSG